MIDRQPTFIGTGALGTALAKALYKKGISIYSLFNRSPESLQALTEVVKPAISARFPKTFGQLGDVIFITTSDDSIQQVANELSNLSNNFSNKTIAHCSGTHSSSILTTLQQKGANTAAFHPNQTFTSKSQPADFNGIYFDIEGNEKAVSVLKQLTDNLNATCFEISPQSKPYLHAAGVTVSNYLIALLDMASTITEMGGLQRNQAINALIPLIQTTLDNAKKTDDLSDALSGPIARGDERTVAKHIELIESNPKIEQLYKLLGQQTLEIAQKNGNQAQEVSQKLEKILRDE